jgi:hypothetical protein
MLTQAGALIDRRRSAGPAGLLRFDRLQRHHSGDRRRPVPQIRVTPLEREVVRGC